MTVQKVINYLKNNNINIVLISDNSIKVIAPKKVLNSGLMEKLKPYKLELINYLKQQKAKPKKHAYRYEFDNNIKGTVLAFGTTEEEREEIIKNFPFYKLKTFDSLN